MSQLEEGKTEYLEIQLKMDVLTKALQYSVESLRDKIVPVLEKEFKTDGTEISSELLREYIQITRNIREQMFKRLDTHVLTIEHLADKILCRRAALERNRKVAVKRAAINAHEDTKIATNIVDSIKNLSPEERAKLASALQGASHPAENKGDIVIEKA